MTTAIKEFLNKIFSTPTYTETIKITEDVWEEVDQIIQMYEDAPNSELEFINFDSSGVRQVKAKTTFKPNN